MTTTTIDTSTLFTLLKSAGTQHTGTVFFANQPDEAGMISLSPVAPSSVRSLAPIHVNDFQRLTRPLLPAERDIIFARGTLLNPHGRPVIITTIYPGEPRGWVRISDSNLPDVGAVMTVHGDYRVNADGQYVHVGAREGWDVVQVEMSDIVSVTYDLEAEESLRAAAALQDADAVADAFKTISRALNSGAGADALKEALAAEHPTLLGKLANYVLEAVDARDGDGRLSILHRTIGETTQIMGADTRISQIRQPFI